MSLEAENKSLREQIKRLRNRLAEQENYIKSYLAKGFIMKKKEFYQQKTFWTAVLYAATIFAPQFVVISPEKLQAVQGLLAVIGAIFMRQGIESGK